MRGPIANTRDAVSRVTERSLVRSFYWLLSFNNFALQDSFQSVVDIFNWYGDMQDDLVPAAGKGHWNDPDMVSGLSL